MTGPCVVKQPFEDRSVEPSMLRLVGTVLDVPDDDRRRTLVADGLVEDLSAYVLSGGRPADYPWERFEGASLSVLPPVPGRWLRVVACLNVWEDRRALISNLETWLPFVDHVIAVDGAYRGVPTDRPWSTDGTIEFLRACPKVELVEARDFWPDQVAKRTEYLKRGQEGDLFFRIDADEAVLNGVALRLVPDLDVGWARVDYPDVYKRPYGQPRLFRWLPGLRYKDRHHWIYEGDRHLLDDQRSGTDRRTGVVPLRIVNRPREGRGEERIAARAVHRLAQVTEEAKVGTHAPTGWESLRILHLARIEYGSSVHRWHSAINSTSTHRSMMARSEDVDPFECPRQFSTRADKDLLALAARSANVVHCHGGYDEIMKLGFPRGAAVVIHHHGTQFRTDPSSANDRDEQLADVRLVSNFELLKYRGRGAPLHWIPNPVPVDRLRALALPAEWEKGRLTVAHSPSRRHLKGTAEFLEAVEILRVRGIKIEARLIESAPLADSLRIKARAQACFDSFFLGMQVSGIEAAAMGRPVLAGDEDCRAGYLREFGEVPWTWAPDRDGLVEALARLATDEEFYYAEAARVHEHVAAVCDDAAVVDRYLDVLDGCLGWREKMRLGVFDGRLK